MSPENSSNSPNFSSPEKKSNLPGAHDGLTQILLALDAETFLDELLGETRVTRAPTPDKNPSDETSSEDFSLPQFF